MILLNWIVKRWLEEPEEYWKIEWLLPLFAKAEEEPFDPATNAFADSQLQDFCCWFRARARSIMKSSDSCSLRRIYLGKTFEHKNHQGGNHQPIWNQCSFLSEHLVSRFLWFHWAQHAFLEPCVDWYRGPLLYISSFLHGNLVVVKPFLPHKLHPDFDRAPSQGIQSPHNLWHRLAKDQPS